MRKGANIVIAAGFLLVRPTATMAKKFPNVHFAITDYSVDTSPFADKKGKVLFSNVEGLTYATNEAGCLVGVLAAKMAQKDGHEDDRCGRRPQDPAGRHLDRRLQVLRAEGRAGHEGAHRSYSQDFVATDKCKTVAQNEIAQGAQVLFQVAGGCGLGTLKAADDARQVGHRRRRRPVQRREARSHERRQAGRQRRLRRDRKQVQQGKFKGGTDLVFNLKNGGIGVGKINPTVPEVVTSTLMNSYKTKIIDGKLKVPAAIK